MGSLEEALLDPLLVEDGSVVEVDGIRMVGRTYYLEKTLAPPIRGVARPGEHTAEVKAEAAGAAPPVAAARGTTRPIGSPLEGVVVLDLGLQAVPDAAPGRPRRHRDQGQQRLRQLLDADEHRQVLQPRKQSITIDLKDLEGMAVLRDLVRTADVVQHNMRYDAAERLGVDYESPGSCGPDLIYCFIGEADDPA